LRIREGEQLDAVGLVKRVWGGTQLDVYIGSTHSAIAPVDILSALLIKQKSRHVCGAVEGNTPMQTSSVPERFHPVGSQT
jgi:hypothetical protein